VVICIDEFGPLNLQLHPGKQWAGRRCRGDTSTPRRRRRRATYTRPHGVRHMFGAYDLSRDRLYGHIRTRKGRTEFLEFLRYVRTLHPKAVRLAIVLDDFSPHLATKKDQRVAEWAAANNVKLASRPRPTRVGSTGSRQFQALRYFTLDGTDNDTHEQQASMIRRYIRWRNRHANDEKLRAVVTRANVA
jgi:hypothetical protein